MRNTYKGIWHDASKERPKQSGEVLVITMSTYTSCVNYSKVWDSFNCYDDMEGPNLDFSDVIAWAYKEDVVADVESELGINFDEIMEEYHRKFWEKL